MSVFPNKVSSPGYVAQNRFLPSVYLINAYLEGNFQ